MEGGEGGSSVNHEWREKENFCNVILEGIESLKFSFHFFDNFDYFFCSCMNVVFVCVCD